MVGPVKAVSTGHRLDVSALASFPATIRIIDLIRSVARTNEQLANQTVVQVFGVRLPGSVRISFLSHFE